MGTSLSSCVAVVFSRHVGFGPRDAGLLVATFALPATLGFVLMGVGLLGPNGFWWAPPFEGLDS